jgi:hypothetical protein
MAERDDHPEQAPLTNGVSHDVPEPGQPMRSDYTIVFVIIGGIFVMFIIGLLLLGFSVGLDWR